MSKLVQTYALPLAFLGFSLYFLASIILQKGYRLTTEDDVFETFTAVFYFIGPLFSVMGFVVARRHVSSIAKYSLLGWAALFFLFAMEEISWGQRVLGVETPGFLSSHNLQNEINLHNFSSHNANGFFYPSVFLVGVALPSSLAMLSRRFGSFVNRWGIPLPQLGLIVPFALAFAFVASGCIVTAPETAVPLAMTLLGLSFVLKTNVLRKDGESTGLSNLQLWIGLAGVVLIQLVLMLFEDNLGHRSQPGEIKEFLFFACFLVFAFRLLGFARLPTPLQRTLNVGV